MYVYVKNINHSSHVFFKNRMPRKNDGYQPCSYESGNQMGVYPIFWTHMISPWLGKLSYYTNLKISRVLEDFPIYKPSFQGFWRKIVVVILYPDPSDIFHLDSSQIRHISKPANSSFGSQWHEDGIAPEVRHGITHRRLGRARVKTWRPFSYGMVAKSESPPNGWLKA